MGPNSIDPDTIDLLTEPTQCSLLADLRGLRVVVVEGQVFPKQVELHTVPIQYDHAVVQVECVCQGHEDHVLQLPPNDETETLGDALLQRIQWRRDRIYVNPTQPTQSQQIENINSAKSASKGNSAIISTKQLCGGNSAPSKQQSPATSDAAKPHKQHKVASEDAGWSAKPPKQHKAASEDARGSLKQQQQQQKGASKYKCGQAFLHSLDLKKAGPGCIALHSYYMKDCIENVKSGILVRFRGTYMLNSTDFEVSLVRYNVLYDLFNFGALDSSLLQCLTL